MSKPCIAFKMNYCDGGKDNDHVGFYGICSNETIKYNIIKAKRRWCSNDRCACKQFFDRKISRKELETFWSPDDTDCYTCYESALLRDWLVEAGWNADGETSRKIRGGEENHLCILTTKYPHMPEESRFVFAMFTMRKIFPGNEEEAGFVSADEYFYLEFRPIEAVKIKFWDFYQNKDDSIRWDSNLFRYFDDKTAVKFLERAIEVKRGTPEEDFAKEFLKQYPYK